MSRNQIVAAREEGRRRGFAVGSAVRVAVVDLRDGLDVANDIRTLRNFMPGALNKRGTDSYRLALNLLIGGVDDGPT